MQSLSDTSDITVCVLHVHNPTCQIELSNTASSGSRMSDITPQASAYPTTTVDVWLYKPVSLFATVSRFSCWPLAVLSRRCAGLRFYCSPNTPFYSLEANLRAALMNDQSDSDSNERKRSTIHRKKSSVAGKGLFLLPVTTSQAARASSRRRIDEIDHMSIDKVRYELASGSGGLCEPLPGTLPFSSVLSPSLYFSM